VERDQDLARDSAITDVAHRMDEFGIVMLRVDQLEQGATGVEA
jgi:hypothetical protein